MEMDVGNDGNIGRADNLFQCGSALHIGARNADNIDACILAAADLVYRRHGITGQRVGHRLHRNRRIAANGDIADHDLAGRAARNIAPGAYGGHKRDIGGGTGERNCLPLANLSSETPFAKTPAQSRTSRFSRIANARAPIYTLQVAAPIKLRRAKWRTSYENLG